MAKLQSAQVFLFVKTNSAVNSLVLIPQYNAIYTSLRFLKYLKDLKGVKVSHEDSVSKIQDVKQGFDVLFHSCLMFLARCESTHHRHNVDVDASFILVWDSGLRIFVI